MSLVRAKGYRLSIEPLYPSVLGLRDSQQICAAYTFGTGFWPVFQSIKRVTVLLPERLWVFSPSAASNIHDTLSRDTPGNAPDDEKILSRNFGKEKWEKSNSLDMAGCADCAISTDRNH